MRLNLYEVHAREKAGLPDDWHAWLFRHMPPGGPLMYTSLTGAVVDVVYKSGQWKGHLNWTKKDKSTVREVIITPAEHDAWLEKWAAKTGLCSRCVGDGDNPAGCRIVDGVAIKERRPCRECGGTGKAKVANIQPAQEPAP